MEKVELDEGSSEQVECGHRICLPSVEKKRNMKWSQGSFSARLSKVADTINTMRYSDSDTGLARI